MAKDRIREAHYENVTFIQADIESDDILSLQVQADLVYSRFFLMHLKKPDAALHKMSGLLKSGGTLVLQEPVNSTTHISGDDGVLRGMINALLSLGSHLGVDYDMGLRLRPLMLTQGLHDIQQKEYQYQMESTLARDLLTMTHQEWIYKALKQGIITEAAYLAMGDKITKLDKVLCFPKQVYVIGKKR